MIPLHEAFLYALGYFEACDGVPIGDCMGLRYGQQPDPERPRSRIVASGPALIGAIRRPGGSPFRRGTPTPPFVPKTPRVPNAGELAALRSDAESRPSSQSPAERRLLRVANWLTEAFSAEELPLVGHWKFFPADDSEPSSATETSRVSADMCKTGKIDFARGEIEAIDGKYGYSKWPDEVRGTLLCHDIQLSCDELFDLLMRDKRSDRLPIFKFDAQLAENASSCIVEFGEYASAPIDLHKKEGVHCALMAIELLIRFHDFEVSPHLLCSLVWRNVNTRQSSANRRMKLESMRKALNKLGLDLYHQKIDIKAAHERLADILAEQEGPSVYSVIPHVMRKTDRPFKAAPEYNRRKSDLSANIKEALEDISDAGRRDLVEFLEKHFEFGIHAYIFKSS